MCKWVGGHTAWGKGITLAGPWLEVKGATMFLLQRKRHLRIELCGRLSVLGLFHVGHVEENR